jgi:hypothetical protein
MLPGVLLALESLDALRFRFLDFAHLLPRKVALQNKKPTFA